MKKLLATLFFSLFPALVMADGALSFAPPPGDYSVIFLGNLFGIVDGVLSGTGSQIMGSMFAVFFTNQRVIDYTSACTQDTALFRKLYHELLQRGVYFAPSPFEANFISIAHSPKLIQETILSFRKAIQKARER